LFTTTWEHDKKVTINQEIYSTLLHGTQVGIQPEGDSIPVAMMKYTIKNADNQNHSINLQLRIGELTTLFYEKPIVEPLFKNIQIREHIINQEEREYEIIWNMHSEGQLYKKHAESIEAYFSIKSAIPFENCVISQTQGLLNFSFDIASKQEIVMGWKIPLLHIDNISQLANLTYETEYNAVKSYWIDRIKDHSKLTIADRDLAEFYEKHLWHMLLTNDREVGAERLIGRVGAMGYGCFANEVCMMTMDLDRRGRFDDARRMLETFIEYQSTAGLDGAYEDLDGIYFGAKGYEQGIGYNQNQGFVLWAMVEHTLLSHDYAWFEQNLESIIAACNWIINERELFIKNLAKNEKQRWSLCPNQNEFLGTGLLPPGGVEDITDYWFWISTNAYNFYGLDQVAKILKKLRHEETGRIQQAADQYRDAIIRNLNLARLRNPVVKLRNGNFIPHIPCHVHRRGRGYGWIQEVLEGGIHLIRTGLIPIHSKEATWILEDLEDNCYLSQEFGYPVTEEEFQKYWYTRGGFCMQPFLLCNHIIYAMRNDYKPFIRALFNSFAVNFRQDTKMFTEHPLPTMFDWYGHAFKTSDEANCCSCLRMMYCFEGKSKDELKLNLEELEEEDFPDTLRLLAGIPEDWFEKSSTIVANDLPTYFGMIKQLSCDKTKFEFQLIRNAADRGMHLKYIIIYLRNSKLKFTQLKVKEGQGHIQTIEPERIILKLDSPTETGNVHLILNSLPFGVDE
jgi:hypothetical protein